MIDRIQIDKDIPWRWRRKFRRWIVATLPVEMGCKVDLYSSVQHRYTRRYEEFNLMVALYRDDDPERSYTAAGVFPFPVGKGMAGLFESVIKMLPEVKQVMRDVVKDVMSRRSE